MQNLGNSYGTYETCNKPCYDSQGHGTCAACAPADSPCGSNGGTRYFHEVDGSQMPNRMWSTMGYGGSDCCNQHQQRSAAPAPVQK